MTGSTLVIQICEKCGYNKYCASIYIFYDYKTELFGLCFGTIDTMSDSDEKCVEKSYAYYCNNEYAIVDFVKNYIPYDSIAELSLINYDDLPKNSDEITYDLLVSMDDVDNEVCSHEFIHSKICNGTSTVTSSKGSISKFEIRDAECPISNLRGSNEDSDKPDPEIKLFEMLNIIRNVYNEY
jgi:hypothetical protein